MAHSYFPFFELGEKLFFYHELNKFVMNILPKTHSSIVADIGLITIEKSGGSSH
jgi:hypothetical protein